MLLDLVQGNHPSLQGVTLLAIGAKLALVYVSVAVRTLRSHVAEYRIGVTLRASNADVHATKSEFGLVVIEFRDAADRFPARRCVAVLARDVQIAVRTARVRVALRICHGCDAAAKQNEQKQEVKRDSSTHLAPPELSSVQNL